VPLVLAPVTVTDKKGNLIDGLKVDDFRLTDEGVAQQIRMDTSDTVLAPVSLTAISHTLIGGSPPDRDAADFALIFDRPFGYRRAEGLWGARCG